MAFQMCSVCVFVYEALFSVKRQEFLINLLGL